MISKRPWKENVTRHRKVSITTRGKYWNHEKINLGEGEID
jgi:hypothetical protein